MQSPFGPLITAGELERELGESGPSAPSPLRIVDVRWRLGKPGAGLLAYRAARIPGAAFLDVDNDLSDIGDPGRGRHPLPSPERLSARLAEIGIGRGTRVVAYDDAGGTHAARLWWLVRWLGGEAAVLDGGLPAWEACGHALETGAPAVYTTARDPLFTAVDTTRVVDKASVRALVDEMAAGSTTTARLLDARPVERYRGDVEPIDPKAGHIPGALSVPASANLALGRFLPPLELKARFQAAGVTRGEDVIAYCGSGVTACHNLLALSLAGFSGARLYAGSWSEWSHDPDAPVATGEAANESS